MLIFYLINASKAASLAFKPRSKLEESTVMKLNETGSPMSVPFVDCGGYKDLKLIQFDRDKNEFGYRYTCAGDEEANNEWKTLPLLEDEVKSIVMDCKDRPITDYHIEDGNIKYRCGNKELTNSINKTLPEQEHLGHEYYDRHDFSCPEGSVLSKLNIEVSDGKANGEYTCGKY